jgi:hypothetical protein
MREFDAKSVTFTHELTGTLQKRQDFGPFLRWHGQCFCVGIHGRSGAA